MSTNRTADDSNKLSSGKQLLEKDRDLCTQWLACSIFVGKKILCSRYRYIELSNRKEKENNFLFLFYDENLKIPLEKLFTTFCMNGEWIALEKFLTLIVFCKGHQRGSLFHSRQMNLNGIMTGFFSLPWCIYLCVFVCLGCCIGCAISSLLQSLHLFVATKMAT